MVEADRGHDRHDAVGHVRRVPGATQTDLHDGDVDRRVGEGRVRQRRHDLEVRQRRTPVGSRVRVDDGDVRRDLVPRRQQSIGLDRIPVEADALTRVRQVRRREQPGAQPEGAEQGLGHPRRRGLAVRAGDVDDRVGGLGAAEQVGERGYPRERRLDDVLRPPLLEGLPQRSEPGISCHVGESMAAAGGHT